MVEGGKAPQADALGLLLTVARVLRDEARLAVAEGVKRAASQLDQLEVALAPFEAGQAAQPMTAAEASEQAGLQPPEAPQATEPRHVVLRISADVPVGTEFQPLVAAVLEDHSRELGRRGGVGGRGAIAYNINGVSLSLDFQAGDGLDGYRSLNQLMGRPVR